MTEIELQLDVYDAIRDAWPKLPRAAHRMALAEAQKSPAFQKARNGNETLAVGEVLDYVKAGPFGAVIDGQEPPEAPADLAAIAAELPAAEAINLARGRRTK